MKYALFIMVLAFGTLGALSFGAFAMSSTGESAVESSAVQKALGFTEEERRIIREVLGAVKRVSGENADSRDDRAKGKGKGAKSMPPGLAKRDELPPGLKKHIEKNGVLPPGLQGRDLPDDLKRRLPKSHKGTKRVIVGDDVVLIEEATRVVIDVIEDVFGN